MSLAWSRATRSQQFAAIADHEGPVIKTIRTRVSIEDLEVAAVEQAMADAEQHGLVRTFATGTRQDPRPYRCCSQFHEDCLEHPELGLACEEARDPA